MDREQIRQKYTDKNRKEILDYATGRERELFSKVLETWLSWRQYGGNSGCESLSRLGSRLDDTFKEIHDGATGNSQGKDSFG